MAEDSLAGGMTLHGADVQKEMKEATTLTIDINAIEVLPTFCTCRTFNCCLYDQIQVQDA